MVPPYDERIKIFKDPIENGNIKSTIESVISKGNSSEDIILICGSFYIMQDVRETFGYADECDPKDVNY